MAKSCRIRIQLLTQIVLKKKITPAKEQVEPDKQIFALYSITNKSFYISNIRKTSFLENYLKNKLKNDVVIKAFLKVLKIFYL